MATLFETAAGFLATATQAAAGRSVSYQQGVGAPISLVGTRSAEDEQIVDEGGFLTSHRQHSFCFKTSALSVEPQPGDRITETVGGVSVTWEVVTHGSERCWVWEDAAKVLIRVYVKQVA